MASESHFDDLRRRYREVDYVSEFQRNWAIFNHWFKERYSAATGRDGIDALKSDDRLVRVLMDLIDQGVDQIVASTIHSKHSKTFYYFSCTDPISSFVAAFFTSTTLSGCANLFGENAGFKVRPTNTIALTSDQFRRAYTEHIGLHSNIMTYGSIEDDLRETLGILGVFYTGRAFYRDTPKKPSEPVANFFAQDVLTAFRSTPELTELVKLIDEPSPAPLTSDVVEMIYTTRNAAIHGSLDFLVDEDNRAARAALDVIEIILRAVRTWG